MNVPVGLFGFATNTSRVRSVDGGEHRVEIVAIDLGRQLDAECAAACVASAYTTNEYCEYTVDCSASRNACAAISSMSLLPLPSMICSGGTRSARYNAAFSANAFQSG